MLREQLAAFVLAVSMLVVAGCGGSSKSGSATTAANTAVSSTTTATTATSSATLPPVVAVPVARGKPLTRARWLANGDAICTRLFGEVKQLSVKGVNELPRVLPQAAAYERATVAELAKIVPPASKANDWETFLRTFLRSTQVEVKLAEYGKLGGAITRSPVATAWLTDQSKLRNIAKHDGFKVCSRL